MTSRRGLEGELDVDLSTATRYSIPYQIYLSRNHLHARERGRRELALRCEPALVRGRRQPARDAARGPAVAPAARAPVRERTGGADGPAAAPAVEPAPAWARRPARVYAAAAVAPCAGRRAPVHARRAAASAEAHAPRVPAVAQPAAAPAAHERAPAASGGARAPPPPRDDRQGCPLGAPFSLAPAPAPPPLAAILSSPTLSGVVAARKLDHHSTPPLGVVARAHARGDAAAGRAHRRPLMSAPRAPVPFALAHLPPIPLPRLSPRSHLFSDLYNSMCEYICLSIVYVGP
jgi:hypothetical protein